MQFLSYKIADLADDTEWVDSDLVHPEVLIKKCTKLKRKRLIAVATLPLSTPASYPYPPLF